ncbi:MAG: Mov34/MPN/PAD-1 family protein [Eubacterium sp.]|nr:Mov34/MPN/PAD-1 family protein [Eubacterium sp.]
MFLVRFLGDLKMKIIFSERAYAGILSETCEKIKTETGGLFLGKTDGSDWYVVEAIDPGPKSIFQVAYFEYDQAYTQHLINKIAHLYEEPLELIGLWHRHPGSFDIFSSTDDGTNAKYAAMRKEGAISCLVNVDPDFRLTCYHVGRPCRYSEIEYEVGDYLIPDELLALRKPEKFNEIMQRVMGRTPVPEEAAKASADMDFRTFLDKALPKLDEYTGVIPETKADADFAADRIIDEIVEDVGFLSDELGVKLFITRKGAYVCLSDSADSDAEVTLWFKYMDETDSLIFALDDKCYVYKADCFKNAWEAAKAEKTETDDVKEETQGKEEKASKKPDVPMYASLMDRIKKAVAPVKKGDKK